MIAMKNKVASYSSLGESNSIFLHTPDDMEGCFRYRRCKLSNEVRTPPRVQVAHIADMKTKIAVEADLWLGAARRIVRGVMRYKNSPSERRLDRNENVPELG
jgi:hypothetical protein